MEETGKELKGNERNEVRKSKTLLPSSSSSSSSSSSLLRMEGILNFSAPTDVALLDRVVDTMYRGAGAEQQAAQRILTQFQEHPDAWMRVDAILESSPNLNSKYFALQILEKLIQTRWKSIPREQCEGIKNYVVSLVIKLASDAQLFTKEKLFIKKLNITLVQILKQDWPHKWPTFISELVGASKTSETLCENNMVILKLLSEEIFDFSAEQMVSQKAKDLKNQMCGEFSEIFHLCILVLTTANKKELVFATLETLLKFLNWVPLGFIFETEMIRILVEKYFPIPFSRDVTLKCLTEIGSLSVGNTYDEQFRYLFNGVVRQLASFLPLETNLAKAYHNGSDDDERFIQDLGLFFCGFLKEHLRLVETPELREVLVRAHGYLLNISEVDDREVFKTCLEYWTKLLSELYGDHPGSTGPLMLNMMDPASQRRQIYVATLSRLRVVMISKMAKPEEVLIVENDEGEIVREFQKDTDTIALYGTMRECLVYLTNLDSEDMENIMIEKLQKQIDGSEWSWNNLNKLCWAVGSISGAMTEMDEKKFLVTVIKDLLVLVEMKRGKDNKAVVASGIMYIVGQYPRFLKLHWKFLKTVVNKLFEFMHELHEGVQDMACDTFIKISTKCKKHFVILQAGEVMPFIDEILVTLPSIISDLQPQQIHTVYEAIGNMIQAQLEPRTQEKLIGNFMELPNTGWDAVIRQAGQNVEVLKDLDKIKNLANILKTNVAACSSIGHPFIIQIQRIYLDMLNLYKVVSEMIVAAVIAQGPVATKTPLIRGMRTIKKEILKLVETFVSKNEDNIRVMTSFIPPLFEAILGDYKRSIDLARDAEVLGVTASIITKLGDLLIDTIPPILDAVFEPTLQMISKDLSEFPEHRISFFKLIASINENCFPALLRLPPPQFKLIVDSIVWGFKHTMRDIGESGLQICYELMGNIQYHSKNNPQLQNQFYQTYFIPLMQDIFVVLTDREHKSGFKQQALVLGHMFHMVETGQIQAPLWTSGSYPSNQAFLREYVMKLLRGAFPQLTDQQIQVFVLKLFELNQDLPAFKSALRDFLVQLNEFVSGDNRDLYAEEAEAELLRKKQESQEKARLIPGMVKPMDRPDDMMD